MFLIRLRFIVHLLSSRLPPLTCSRVLAISFFFVLFALLVCCSMLDLPRRCAYPAVIRARVRAGYTFLARKV